MSIKSDSNQSKASTRSKNGKRASADDTPNVHIKLSDLGLHQKSPSDLDLEIQSGRILHVLDRGLEKLIVAACLPCLVAQDGYVIEMFLTEDEVEFILNACRKYQTSVLQQQSLRFTTANAETMSAIINKISMHQNISKRKTSRKMSAQMANEDQVTDPNIAHAIELIWNHKILRSKLLSDYERLVDQPSKALIESMKHLRTAAEYRLSMSAADERKKERQLRRAWKANAAVIEKIREAEHHLERQRKELGKQLEEKSRVVDEYMKKIGDIRSRFRKDIAKLIEESEREMARDTQASEARQAELSVDAKAATQQYENLLNQNIGLEKGLRAKRFKVETQLASWLTKFDADIGDRQAEFEEITAGYEGEMREMEALQEKFDEQEEEYTVLMGEKEEEERKVWEEKAFIFLMNRSARRIQRCWRAYKLRKLERKKSKKAKAKAKKQKSEDQAKKDEPSGRGDPMATLDKKFGGEIMEDLKGEEFHKEDVVVDLSAEPSGVTEVTVE